MNIVGYGICGPGEAQRYMRETLDEFKRLCDTTVILCNNVGPAELALIAEYGFHVAHDNREWGKLQWKIKEDFLKWEVAKYAGEGDMLVCLDMDETLDPKLSRTWIQEAELDAYHVFVVDLWNDPQHYKPEACFWNVRMWRWNGVVSFKQKPVHCGLAPEWAYHYQKHAPFLLLHKGLMDPADRARKIARYEKYDPLQQHLGKQYYWLLKTDTAEPFDLEAVHATIAEEVASYKQTKPRSNSPYMPKPAGRFAYVRNPGGNVVDVPEKNLKETLNRKGFSFVGWADDATAEMEALFEDETLEEHGDADDATVFGQADTETPETHTEYHEQHGTGHEPHGTLEHTAPPEGTEAVSQPPRVPNPDVDELKDRGPKGDCRACKNLPEGQTVPGHDHRVVPPAPAQHNRLGMKESEKIRQAKKAPAKKAK